MPVILKVMFCPRCDNPYEAATYELALKEVKEHVSKQHPDHDPNWHETYPDGLGED